jgi:hypothetical protein
MDYELVGTLVYAGYLSTEASHLLLESSCSDLSVV